MIKNMRRDERYLGFRIATATQCKFEILQEFIVIKKK